jgi:DnaK suppressor protein
VQHLQLSCDIDMAAHRHHVAALIAGDPAIATRRRSNDMATATLQATRAHALDYEALTGEQLTILRERLESERSAVLSRVRERLGLAAPLETHHPDEMDEVSANQDLALLFRLADKEQKLLGEIDSALARLNDGSYGVCQGTGEPIEYRRLLARPWARFSVAYKEALEREQARPGR